MTSMYVWITSKRYFRPQIHEAHTITLQAFNFCVRCCLCNLSITFLLVIFRDPVMIEWFHEGTPVLSPHGDDHRIVLPDGSLFFLRALRGIDDGNYWCVASNLDAKPQSRHDPINIPDLTSNRVARSRNATLRVACKFVNHY